MMRVGVNYCGIGHQIKLIACALLSVLAVPGALFADEFRPALLEITEREGGWVRPSERGFDFLSDLQALFLPD